MTGNDDNGNRPTASNVAGVHLSANASCRCHTTIMKSQTSPQICLPDTIVAAQHKSSRDLSMSSNVSDKFGQVKSEATTVRYVRAQSARSRKMKNPSKSRKHSRTAFVLPSVPTQYGKGVMAVCTNRKRYNPVIKYVEIFFLVIAR